MVAPKAYCFIPNTDHRFTYPSRFVKCFSEADKAKTTLLLDEICSTDVVFMHHYDGEQNPFGPNKMKLVGVNALIELMTIAVISAPDMVVTMYDPVTGHSDPDTDEGFLTYKLIMSTTKVNTWDKIEPNVPLDPNPPLKFEDVMPSNSGADETFESEQPSTRIKTDPVVDDLVASFDTFTLKPLQPTQQIQKSYNVGKFFMTLNPQHKITHIGHVFKVVAESPLIHKIPIEKSSKSDRKKSNRQN